MSLFSSFGYWPSDAENLTILHNLATTLRSGGELWLDYLNIHYLQHQFRPYEEVQINGILFRIRRLRTPRYVFKIIEWDQDGRPIRFYEQLRLYSEQDLKNMLHTVGLLPLRTWYDYAFEQTSPFAPTASRVIIQSIRQS